MLTFLEKNSFVCLDLPDMYSAIDDITLKLDRFLVKIKNKFVSLSHSKPIKKNFFLPN